MFGNPSRSSNFISSFVFPKNSGFFIVVVKSLFNPKDPLNSNELFFIIGARNFRCFVIEDLFWLNLSAVDSRSI